MSRPFRFLSRLDVRLPLALVLCASLAAVARAQVIVESEPNNSPATATSIQSGEEADGTIHPVGDVDYFRFVVIAPSDLLAFTGPSLFGPLNDPDLTLIDTDGVTELELSEDLSPSNYHCRIVHGPLLPGTYYLRVRSSAAYSPSGTGAYGLDLVLASPGTYVPLPTGPQVNVNEAPEDNDPRNQGGVATASFENSLNSGHLASGSGGFVLNNPYSDYDCFEIVVGTPGTLHLETLTGAPAPWSQDTCIFLLGGTWNYLAGDDDSGDGTLSKLTYPVAPGTYRVLVKGYASSSFGNYILSSRLLFAPPGRATVNVVPGGCGNARLGPAESTYPVARTETPVLGSTYRIHGRNLPPNAPVVRILGFAVLSPAYDLGPHGAPGCRVEVDPLITTFAFADAAGADTWSVVLPLVMAFSGLRLQQQVFAFDPNANPFGGVISNRVVAQLGPQPQ